MKISEARYRANKKWNAANLDRIEIQVPKGRKEAIKAQAAARGESLNSFVIKAIDERIERLNKNNIIP